MNNETSNIYGNTNTTSEIQLYVLQRSAVVKWERLQMWRLIPGVARYVRRAYLSQLRIRPDKGRTQKTTKQERTMNKDKRYIEIFRAALEEYPCSGGAEASIGFFYGALWADKHPNFESVWHDASEEPQGNSWDIMCQNKKGEWYLECKADAMRLPVTWDEYAAIKRIIKWAYVKDLLPKGGEK